MKTHHYELKLNWTGNTGKGTKNYRSYERSHSIHIPEKVDIQGSSDPAFRGDPTKHNPEELFLSSISSCHMLWYLHFCAEAKIVVTDYQDQAKGSMVENENGSGQFTEVQLNPVVTITDPDKVKLASDLHHKANQYCFIANSCNFPIQHQPVILLENNNES